jgi:hypothetical protein
VIRFVSIHILLPRFAGFEEKKRHINSFGTEEVVCKLSNVYVIAYT